MIMIHTLLNGESPEVIRYFRHLEYLTALWKKVAGEFIYER